jgi:hypothetical protein
MVAAGEFPDAHYAVSYPVFDFVNVFISFCRRMWT